MGMPPDQCERLISALGADDLTRDDLGLTAGDRALLEYAGKLTRTPGDMGVGDVDRLRQAGFDDRAIHDACAIVGYFAFVNRIADGLGVEMDTPAR